MGTVSSTPGSPISGNSHSAHGEPLSRNAEQRAARWALARRFVDVAKVFYPELGLESVVLCPRQVFLEAGRFSSYEEVQRHLRGAHDIMKKEVNTRLLYVCHMRQRHSKGGRGLEPETEEMARERYHAVHRFLTVHTEFGYLWVDRTCLPKRLREPQAPSIDVGGGGGGGGGGSGGGSAGSSGSGGGAGGGSSHVSYRGGSTSPSAPASASSSSSVLPGLPAFLGGGSGGSSSGGDAGVEDAAAVASVGIGWPGAAQADFMQWLQPTALLACDATLIVPPVVEEPSWGGGPFGAGRQTFTDLQLLSQHPWKSLEMSLALLGGATGYLFFSSDGAYRYKRLGASGFFGSGNFFAIGSANNGSGGSAAAAAYAGGRAGGRGAGGGGGGGSGGGSGGGDPAYAAAIALLAAGSTAVAAGAAAMLDGGSSGADGGAGGGGGVMGVAAAQISWALEQAVHELGLAGRDSAAEKNWREMVLPDHLLQLARNDVRRYCGARGALKQSICTMSVTVEQAEEFFQLWPTLKSLGSTGTGPADWLSVLNLLCFGVAFAEGLVAPPPLGLASSSGGGGGGGGRGSVNANAVARQLLAETLSGDGRHMDLWMRDLSPPELSDVLRLVAKSAARLEKLTVGSSHTGGAGIGSFLAGAPSLREVELEWEGVRDVSVLASGLRHHPRLARLSLTHNFVGQAGAAQLAEALKWNTTLTELDLRENCIGSVGLKQLAIALALNGTLRTLHVQDNGVGDDGAIDITEALMRNTTLAVVSLDGNDITDVGGRTLLIAVRENPALTQLSLGRNQLSDLLKEQLREVWDAREWPRPESAGSGAGSGSGSGVSPPALPSTLPSMAFGRAGCGAVPPPPPSGLSGASPDGGGLRRASTGATVASVKQKAAGMLLSPLAINRLHWDSSPSAGGAAAAGSAFRGGQQQLSNNDGGGGGDALPAPVPRIIGFLSQTTRPQLIKPPVPVD